LPGDEVPVLDHVGLPDLAAAEVDAHLFLELGLEQPRRSRSQPDGLLHQSAGFDDNGVFRSYEVWQSSDDRQRFVKDRLEPILAEGPVDTTRTDPPSRDYGYELHYSG